MPLRALRAKLAREMPVTQSLGIRVVGRQDGGLVLEAPLAANINHTGTAFAGSLNAAATLAGWGTVWLLLRERGMRAHVVLQDSTVHYVRPVTGDFTARCLPPDDHAVARLVDSLARRGRGRIELHAVVSDRDGDAVTYRGRYVALRESKGGN